MSFVHHWSVEPMEVVPVLVLVVAYWQRVRTLAAKGRPVPRRRQAAFATGIILIVLALVSPLDWYAENRLLWVHMIQHLMLGDVAPAFLVLGVTGAVLRPILRVRALRRLRALAHPLVSLPLWIIDLYVWHLPFMYQAALDHDQTVHPLEHICFFMFGTFMWATVIEPLPGPAWFSAGWKFAYAFVIRVVQAIIANVFIWAQTPFYGYYVDIEHRAAAVTDQRTAGLIMFVEGSFITVVALCWLFMRFMREAEIRQRLIDQGVDAAVAARSARSPSRSARAREVSR